MYRVQENITLNDLKKGSDLLFKKVYEDNRDKFLNFARKYHLPQEDVIDVYQDTYIIFYNNVMQGKIEEFTSSISTYLFSIGKYLIFDKMKKNKKTINPEFDLSLFRGKEELVDPNIDMDQETLSVEQVLLKKYFSTLGKKCQELLTLFYYRGYSIKDIIEMSEYTSENVVKSAKSRCMKTLKERINSNAQ